jgi:predicted metal-dependent peptidase
MVTNYDAVLSTDEYKQPSPASQARSWFINSYPIFGALAISFRLIEDPEICLREDVVTAAVCAESREIFINSSRELTEQQCRFVLAHEFLHVGLRHHARTQGRDPFLWNVACDYVINGWLKQMKIGAMLPDVLYDSELNDQSAEQVYDRITGDLRLQRRLVTLRGVAHCGDMIEKTPEWWLTGEGVSLDHFYRRCLFEGLQIDCCGRRTVGRGVIPSGLSEDVRILCQPAISWEVQLAQWFDEQFSPAETRRTYARPSRRQASSPDIARPRYFVDLYGNTGDSHSVPETTLGVILDTSASMSRLLMGKGLGAIASFAQEHGVHRIRLVYCDAKPQDRGYINVSELEGYVKVHGRGGTILQPAVDLLESVTDFPANGPLLIVTDGACDILKIKRTHAYLLPEQARLPFPPQGSVFFMSPA